jgi:hypothetical protein
MPAPESGALSLIYAFQRPQSTACRISLAPALLFSYIGNMRLELHPVTKAEPTRPIRFLKKKKII